MTGIELVERAVLNADRTAIVDGHGEHTYRDLLDSSEHAAQTLLDGAPDLAEARVAFMVAPSFEYTRVFWGIWRAGGVAVPLCLTHPVPELEHVLDDSGASVVVGAPEYEPKLKPLAIERGLRYVSTADLDTAASGALPSVGEDRRAMILYTSGTTGKPKGVVSMHRTLSAQIRSLVTAWEWTSNDRILLTLPLHHLHGILNILSCALWSGATCETLPKFDRSTVWDRIASGDLTLFMAVPTIYHRLIDAWEAAGQEEKASFRAGSEAIRLMVCGSAALPVSVLEKWREVSGHTLLERYGMTEIGMALSNPLHGERYPGRVGMPLPGVEVRLVNEAGEVVSDGSSGQIQIKGSNVFEEYWRNPEATAETFTDDGWFLTGDVAVEEDGVYRILGRNSVDIIKSGGEKISALDIESVLLAHDAISEVAVVGVPDDEWGQRIEAAVVKAGDAPLDEEAVRAWCRDRLAPYKVPKVFHVVDSLPRNALGKVTKPVLIEQLSSGS